MGLVNATNGMISAKYEYGPFGEVFSSVGDMAKVNPFQFSTKYTDSETDLVYYGYRYYSPALGRWMSRDPIDEQGGLNLYAFVNNDPVNKVDVLGKSLLILLPNPPPPRPPFRPPGDRFSSIQLCNRVLVDVGIMCDPVVWAANIRGHDFYRWPDGNGGYGSVGFQNNKGKCGTKPGVDIPDMSRSCRHCYKTNAKLKYGDAKDKFAYEASDKEIQDCLYNRPIGRKWFCNGYQGLFNNCNDWADDAGKDCGLACPKVPDYHIEA